MPCTRTPTLDWDRRRRAEVELDGFLFPTLDEREEAAAVAASGDGTAGEDEVMRMGTAWRGSGCVESVDLVP